MRPLHPKAVWLIYLGLAAIIMLPLLPPGYILTLDMVFVPHMPFPAELSNTYILDMALWALTTIIPGDIVQKLMLFAILVGSGVGAHALIKSLTSLKLTWASYFAGIFYMVNPFVYSRFMAGQWLVLLGYALLPFFTNALLRLIAQPNRTHALQAGALLGGIGLVSIHMFGVAFVIAGVGATVAAWQSRRATKLFKKGLMWVAASGGVALALNSFWLVPSLLGHTSTAQATTSFNDTQFVTFATDTNTPLGAVGNVVMLQGFWLEPRALYTLPQQRVPGWLLFVAIIWVLVALGFAAGIKTNPLFTKLAAGLIIAGIILAATPLIDWLRHVIPFVSGYREPHKFAVLVALGFAMLGGIGVATATNFARRRWNSHVSKVVAVGLLFVPYVITPVMVWGFGGQLQPSTYPGDWYAMNAKLNAQATDGAILFLPWHQYMVFGFTGRIIATPADKFFDRPIIVSDNPEFNNVAPTIPNAYRQKIEAVLFEPDAAARLAALNIRYVLVAKEYDFDSYTALRQSPGMQLLSEDDSFELYKNNAKEE
ncbi:MAG TPA: hypothetical protein VM581_04685 [Magnetospirillaceae bacterium]|nr:hypothetical protein [Magnetospirillaceae bacterium]